MKNKVLLIEDDLAIANFMMQVLKDADFLVEHVNSGKLALNHITSDVPDLVLLDLGLPDMEGTEVLLEIRKWSNLPIIVVSARADEQEKVRALDLGADDYITKPFGTEELLARIRTALRHSVKSAYLNQVDVQVHTIGALKIDESKGEVLVRGEEVHLTPTEYRILLLFAHNIGKILTYDFIIKHLWGPYAGNAEKQKLRVNMANLRGKIEENPTEPEFIMTEISVGYRMKEQ